MENIFNSLKAQLYDRAVSPLMGSYILSWCLWNYKFILLAFSDMTFQEKYWVIEYILYYNSKSLAYSLLIPLVGSIFYIFAYPFPARFCLWFTLKQQKLMNNLKREINDETLLSAKESYEMRRTLRDTVSKYQSEVDELHKKNELVEADLKRSNEKILELEGNFSEEDGAISIVDDIPENLKGDDSSNIEISDVQIRMLNLFKNGDLVAGPVLRQVEQENRIKSEYALQDLVRKGYLLQRGMEYKMTQEGRKAFLDLEPKGLD